MSSMQMASGKRALITGITGQDGSYLAELLLEKGYEIWGIVRQTSTSSLERIAHLYSGHHDPASRVQLLTGDLGDALSLKRAVGAVRPHEVYNLAAQSHVKASFELPEYTGDITGLGVVRLLEAIRQLELDARFYQASSSELFGKVVETPQNESTPFYPRSPYAAAKAYAFDMTRNYREAYGMYAVNGILFNHESPRRGTAFVTRKITQAVAQIRSGRKQPLYLGNLEARRDWGHARDYVDAMWRMMQLDEPEDFVIAMGETHSVREFCTLAFGFAGIDISWEGEGLDSVGRAGDGQVLVAVDPMYFRPTEVDVLVGDTRKAQRILGWKPTIGFEELVRSMVEADIAAAASLSV